MRVLLINTVCGQGSTGRICTGIADMLREHGHEAYIAYGLGSSNYPNSIYIGGGRKSYLYHNAMSRLTDSEGLHSSKQTKYLISKIKEIQPDIVHIHTLHGHYINYELLFKYLLTTDIRVVITLHDCWFFTGRCAHFVMQGCEKWKVLCHNCQHLDEYPQSWFLDNSKRNYNLKRNIFNSFGDRLTVVPVSYWLERYVRQSFLRNHNILTIHNGIDLDQFCPSYNTSFIENHHLQGKHIVLGVALPWSMYKGFHDFTKLRSLLSDEYVLIMVGLSEEQISSLPKGIIGVGRIDEIGELASLYSISEVLVNTTYCDNYPTVNLEAIACGTPVITYNTGGSPESIIEGVTGFVVEQGDLQGVVLGIHKITNGELSPGLSLRDKAKDSFDKALCFRHYVDLFEHLIQ